MIILIVTIVGNDVDGAVLRKSEEVGRLLEEELGLPRPLNIATETMTTILTDNGEDLPPDLLLPMWDPQEDEDDKDIAAAELDEDLPRILPDHHPWLRT
jgi:hypothetical protein